MLKSSPVRSLVARLCGILFILALPACQTLPQPSGGLTPAQVQVLQREGFRETDEGWMFSMADKLLFESLAGILDTMQ